MNSPYLILPLAVLSLVLYFISLSLSKLQIIRRVTHRKIWNLLLLVTFLVTALLGLILAIQVNYKLKLPFLKQMLIWHVDFGIGMTMIAVFHFLWHWSYFIHIFRKHKKDAADSINLSVEEQFPGDTGKWSAKTFAWSAVLLGFTTILTQVVMLREFLMVFDGNELIIGIILAIWMVLTATGAFLGRLVKEKRYSPVHIAIAFIFLGVLPIVGVFLANFLKNIVFQPGVAFGIFKIVYSTTFILLPFCLLSGFLFTNIAVMYSAVLKKKKIDKIYAFESAGSILGGLVFSYLLASLLSTFQVLAMLFFINVISSLFISRINLYARIILAFTAFSVLLVPFLVNVDQMTKQFLFPHQEIKYLKDTPFGNLVVTAYGDQANFYENSVLMFTTENTVENEEAVHYAMIQHKSPKDVLLISGGISGITEEILKYHTKQLDYVELNPWIVKLGQRYTPALEKPGIQVINEDARLYIKKTDRKYDVVIINLPDPVTAQINRYYTIDFFREIKSNLNHGGIVAFGLSSTANYLSDKVLELNSVIYKTVKNVFNHVLVFPGEKNHFVLSDNPLRYNITGLFEEKGIENIYVNKYYLNDELITQRAELITSSLKPEAKINRDFSPIAYFTSINYWLSKFGPGKTLIFPVAVIILLFIILLVSAHPANTGMLMAGYTASAMEVLLIILFQVIYGYIYILMGAFFAVFMGGLTLGAASREKIIPRPVLQDIGKLQLLMVLLIVISLPVIALLRTLTEYKALVFIVCFGILFLVAFLVGIFFSLASGTYQGKVKNIAAGIYSYDLLGSAIGAFFTSIILIPLLGLYWTIAVTAGLSLLTWLVVYIKSAKLSV
ncbi:MAG: fused MFS/spermidine synthase [Bacteroidales bacterium]|nr:fused MFS/spermidine synthase [Bacteroidales bacterium]